MSVSPEATSNGFTKQAPWTLRQCYPGNPNFPNQPPRLAGQDRQGKTAATSDASNSIRQTEQLWRSGAKFSRTTDTTSIGSIGSIGSTLCWKNTIELGENGPNHGWGKLKHDNSDKISASSSHLPEQVLSWGLAQMASPFTQLSSDLQLHQVEYFDRVNLWWIYLQNFVMDSCWIWKCCDASIPPAHP